MKTDVALAVIQIALLAMTGCSTMLPSSKVTVDSRWRDFDSAKAEYEKIIPGKTTLQDLKEMGFDPYTVPNIRILTATDVISIFMPNPSIKLETLDPGLQKCIESKGRCIAYRIEPTIQNNKRIGSFWLDLLSFKRDTVSSGWEFKGLITIVDGTVVYRDPVGGRPSISTEEVQTKPLGPLQDIGGILTGAAPSVWK